MTFTRPGTKTASSTESTATTSASTPRTWAAARRRRASPMTTGRQSSAISGSTSAPTTTSGPTPAPSPMVTATNGVGAEVSVGWLVGAGAGVMVFLPSSLGARRSSAEQRCGRGVQRREDGEQGVRAPEAARSGDDAGAVGQPAEDGAVVDLAEWGQSGDAEGIEDPAGGLAAGQHQVDPPADPRQRLGCK